MTPAEERAAIEALERAWREIERIPLGGCTYADRITALEALQRFKARQDRAAGSDNACAR